MSWQSCNRHVIDTPLAHYCQVIIDTPLARHLQIKGFWHVIDTPLTRYWCAMARPKHVGTPFRKLSGEVPYKQEKPVKQSFIATKFFIEFIKAIVGLSCQNPIAFYQHPKQDKYTMDPG